MKNTKNTNSIKVLLTNQPTPKQAEEHIKKLSEYLGKIWNKPKGSR